MSQSKKIPQTKNAPKPKAEQKPEPRIHLDLPLSAVDLIYRSLAEQPWKNVQALMKHLETQVTIQLAPKEEPKEGKDPSVATAKAPVKPYKVPEEEPAS